MPTDVETVFEKLSHSAFRRRFALGPKERAYLEEKGLAAVLEHGAKFIQERLAPANPTNDGKQTPMRNHPIFIAQHGTATCCRGCLEQWHGISKGQALSDDDKAYILDVLKRWLTDHADQ
jgi:hypothetical protein